MPARKVKNQSIEAADQILTVLQDLFILEGLKAGMKVQDIRKTLRVDMWRVANISKCLKQEQKQDERKHRT